MFDKSFEEMGIPAGYGLKHLMFSPKTSVLVVQVQSGGNEWRPDRLYFRHTTSNTYEQIGRPGELVAQESPILHSSKPLLAYNSMPHHFSIDARGEKRHGGDWDAVKLFDLESRSEIDFIDAENLKLPSGARAGWISSLIAFSDLGLFVTAGLSETGTRMDYFVAELDLAQKALKPISRLPATFM